jgi:manganese/zinc/iron transport system ATP- binding protein
VPNTPALEAHDLCVKYKGANDFALKDIRFCVQPGTRIALIGPNGSGKSTLLKSIAGLLPIASGSVRIHGHAIGKTHSCVAYLPQRGELDWKFPISLRKLVLTGRYVHLGWLRQPSQNDWDSTDNAIQQMRLSDLAERQICELSGGQQQRALIARAIAQDADLLLLDEPLNAVDAPTRDIVAHALVSLGQRGKTTIVATHDIDHVDTQFDGALYLVDGKQVHMNLPCFDANGIHHQHKHQHPLARPHAQVHA